MVIARDENTRLTAGEARMSALAGILTGFVFTSDHLGKMADRSSGVALHGGSNQNA